MNAACPDDHELALFLDGLLPEARRDDFEAHLDTCADCRRVVGAAAWTRTVPVEDPPVDRALSRGDTVGRYLIVSLLGQGAMGRVYAAYDPELDRRIALKLLRSAQGSAGARRLLLREARGLGRLSHPNVVQVHDVGEHEGKVFVAMELVDGRALDRFCHDPPVPGWREVLAAYVDAALGLSAAHAKGLVHRDVKPSNILRGNDGRVRVADFGLVLGHGGDEGGAGSAEHGALGDRLTATGAVVGTPLYMAPEQHRSAKATAASDQYSLCAALHEGLYGAPPFRGSSPDALLAAKEAGPPPSPPEGSEVPAWIYRALARALAPDPGDRHPSMDALVHALRDDPEIRSPLRPFVAEPGAQLAHYEIIRKLGEGGMGAVFLARDTRLGRRVAIKLLHERGREDVDRFRIEARATALCEHPNIVVIHEVGDVDDRPYMVLEHIEGRTLRAALEERKAGAGEAGPAESWGVEVMLPVARALARAHAMRIVHRDLKPENILLSNGGLVKVVDFGIAKQLPPPLDAMAATVRTEDLGADGATLSGVVTGTLSYMAPEQWSGGEIDGRTDLWAAGLILFEMLTGAHPLAPLSSTSLAQVPRLDLPMPSARAARPDAGALGEIIDRCLQKRREDRYASAEELSEALQGLSRSAVAVAARPPEGPESGSPFAGLSAFQEADAGRYFGREQEVEAMIGKLRQEALIAIVAPSGAGKSSLVRAGVIPALKGAGRRVASRVIRPGRRPLAALAEVVASLGGAEPAKAAETLSSEPGYLGARLRAWCREQGPDQQVLLFVDQFEELYTLGADADARAAFCACLSGVADDASAPLRVILAVRADFFERIAEDRRFLAEVASGLYFLPPMGAEGLRAALEQPLKQAGYAFEDERLAEEILGGLAGMKSPLPILQFAATKLWEERDRAARRLTRAAFAALGGASGALSAHADAVLAAMPPAEQRLAGAVLLRLVTPERTRAIVAFADLCALSEDQAAEHVVQRLAAARLVAIEAGGDGEGKTAELVHESLIERWPKLRSLLDEEEQDAVFLAELRAAAAQWEKNGRSAGFLWRDEAARRAELWRATRQAAGEGRLGQRERAYLDAVVRHAARGRRRQRAVVAAVIGATAVFAAVVSVLALRARALAVDARTQAGRADAKALQAEEEARQARNATRMAAAREAQNDATTALALLREIEPGPLPRGWAPLAVSARSAGVARLVLQHEGPVFGLAVSPDGRRIASGGGSDDVYVSELDAPDPPIVLRGHGGRVLSVAVSPDGKRVASASVDQTVRVWSADGRGPALVLRGHEGMVFAVAWSPDGQRIASGSGDKTVRVWSADGAGSPLVLRGHDDRVNAVAFRPDGQRIASGSADKSVQVWNADGTGAPLVLRGHDDHVVKSVAWSPDGQRIASASTDKTLRVWSVPERGVAPGSAGDAGHPLVLRGHDEQVISVAWSRDGKRIVTGGSDLSVRVWSVDGARPPLVLRGHGGTVSAVAWSPDGQRVITGSEDRTVRVWDVGEDGQTLSLRGHERGVSCAQPSPDGRHIVSSSFDRTVRVWNADGTGEPLVLRGHESMVEFVVYSPDGERVASGSDDKTVRVWSAHGTGRPIVLRGHEATIWSLTFRPDGQRIASASVDKTVRVWNADGTGEPLVLRGHDSAVYSAAWSPDGKRIVSASADKTLRVWNADGTGEPLVLRSRQCDVSSAVWSPDGKRILSGCLNKALQVWSADGTGEPLVLRGHEAGAFVWGQGVWSPDGTRFVSSSNDNTARIWNADGTGEPIVLRKSGANVLTASWSPDGKSIVAAGGDTTVIVFRDLEPLRGADDLRLWTGTRYCMPLEARQRLLGFPEAQSRADLAACERRVAEAAHP